MSNDSDSVALETAGDVVLDLVVVIAGARTHLSEIDGAIGDGDHGINLSKGFRRCAETLGTPAPDLRKSFDALGRILLCGIGGSMGPLYGTFFIDIGKTLDGASTLDAPLFLRMLRTGIAGVEEIGGAKVGDKTLIDTLVPAADAFEAKLLAGRSFADCLAAMSEGAERGRDSTRDMVARLGRASRLGERSRGAVDAGATSCCLILQSIAQSLTNKLEAHASGRTNLAADKDLRFG